MTGPLGTLMLGMLQGVTEFLPVSSSGHLALLLAATGTDEHAVLPLIVAMHAATTMAVLVYFRGEVSGVVAGLLSPRSESGREGRRLALLVALGTVPAGVIGLAFKDLFERLFVSPLAIAAGLALTGAVLWAAGAPRRADETPLTPGGALAVGLAQAAAIAPGISRSGATLGAALLLGAGREEAFCFSFLLSVPANAGAFLLEARALGGVGFDDILLVIMGMAAAFVSGYAALALLSRWVREGRLRLFSFYCWAAALAVAAAVLGSGPWA